MALRRHVHFSLPQLLWWDDLSAFLVVWWLVVEWNVFANASQLQAVELASSCVVSFLHTLFVQVVVLEEVLKLLVATESHQSELLLGPSVHGEAPDERDVCAH